MRTRAAIASLVVLAVLPAAAGSRSAGPPDSPGPPRGCVVTPPSAFQPPGGAGPAYRYGDRRFYALFPTRDGVIRARPGSVSPALRPDGTVRSKVPWFSRVVRRGTIRISGYRTDDPGQRMRQRIRTHLRGMWPSGVVWPSVGCWKMDARVGRERIAMTIAVVPVD